MDIWIRQVLSILLWAINSFTFIGIVDERNYLEVDFLVEKLLQCDHSARNI